MNLIAWATQYLDVANDGFKAELLWWKWATGAEVEIPLMTFNTPEGMLYASRFDARYAVPVDLSSADVQSAYTRQHLAACVALHTGEYPPPNLDGSEDHNAAVHKILWASGLGQRTVNHSPPQVIISGILSEDDNTHAMSVMAMRLLGHDLSVRPGITDVELSPSTYHAAMVADVCAYLPKE